MSKSLGVIVEDLSGSYTEISVRIRVPLERGIDYFIYNESDDREISLTVFGDKDFYGPGELLLPIEEQVITAPTGSQIFRDAASLEMERIVFAEKLKKIEGNKFSENDVVNLSFTSIQIDKSVKSILEMRWVEAQKAFHAGAYLSTIFMCGSILEGLLWGLAKRHPKKFNTCKISPKDKERKVLPFHKWSLSQFIDVANHLGFLDLHIQKFSHVLRDFRNYIHPFEEMKSKFAPNLETARICMQVLRAAVVSLSTEK